MPLRPRTISRAFAVWLVVLIVLPFTAPWGTCDFSDLTGTPSSRDGLAKTNISPDETLVGPTDAFPIPPALNVVAVKSIDLADLIDVSPLRQTVLRV